MRIVKPLFSLKLSPHQPKLATVAGSLSLPGAQARAGSSWLAENLGINVDNRNQERESNATFSC